MSKGMVPPNKLYGAKFTLSFKSKEHWYAINEYTGKRMQYWCIPILLSGIIALLLPNILSEKTLAFYAIFPLCILIPAFQGWRFAKRFDAEWERKQQP